MYIQPKLCRSVYGIMIKLPPLECFSLKFMYTLTDVDVLRKIYTQVHLFVGRISFFFHFIIYLFPFFMSTCLYGTKQMINTQT